MFPRPLTAKAMAAHAELALSKVPYEVRSAATVRASNLNKNYFIQFTTRETAERFVKILKDSPVSWIDPRRANEDDVVPIYFKPDRSLPERLLGQVMGSFYGQIMELLKRKDAERFKKITMHTSPPKGIVFAVENGEAYPLATAKYVADKQFELQAEAEGIAHFGITLEEARSIISSTRTVMAAKAVKL